MHQEHISELPDLLMRRHLVGKGIPRQLKREIDKYQQLTEHADRSLISAVVIDRFADNELIINAGPDHVTGL